MSVAMADYWPLVVVIIPVLNMLIITTDSINSRPIHTLALVYACLDSILSLVE
jgi:hypothetical protein